MYLVFQIGRYDLCWAAQNQATVAAGSVDIAISLLEEKIRKDPKIREEFREGNIGFTVWKDTVVDSGVRADKMGVLYPF